MTPRNFGRLFIIALACCLLNGCRSDFHLVLFNGTDDTIVLRRRTEDPFPLVVVAGISGEITGVSADDFSIERKGKVLHYAFPLSYSYPSESVPSGYQRKMPKLGRSFCFKLSTDNRIYILRKKESFNDKGHQDQPPGFPLLPH